MNQQLHRLVFSRRHGMRVAVAENARSSGKAAGGERSPGAATATLAAAAFAVLMTAASAQTRPPVVFASKLPAPATTLPVPYASSNPTPRPFAYDPAKGGSSADLRAAGRVRWSVNGNTATFDQGSVERVVVNWDSFNIGAGNKVHFAQDKDPAKYVSALNRIWSADPTQIFGSLTADREVILLNANGVYFGRGARVDTGKFVATALSIADSVFDKGLRNVIDGSAVFGTVGSNYLPTNLDSAVTVEAGAEIRSAAGGDVLLIAPRVVNQGRIDTPKGQTVLVAGDKVYLMSSSDPKQRGLIVAVDPIMVAGTSTNDTTLGIAENATSGSFKTVDGATVADSTPDNTSGLVKKLNEIRAESGTVNLVGLTVRQNGTINATTAVKGANGAIYLQAMASTASLIGGTQSSTPAGRRGLMLESGGSARVGALLGTVEIGAGSVTSVQPSASAATQIDAEAFNPSVIRVEGAAIHVASLASITAPAGRIELLAAVNSLSSPLFDNELSVQSGVNDGSRVVVAPGASLDAAGLRGVAVDGARNQGAQRLFRIELADAPVQRDSVLYRNQVFFDQRDGSKISTANVSGAAAAIGRGAAERSTSGGSVRIESEGSVVVGQDTSLNVSGGSVQYSETALDNSLVVRDGRVMTFATAGAADRLDRLLPTVQTVISPGYSEGKDGGSLTVGARQIVLAGAMTGAVLEGERQRDGRATRAAPGALTIGRQLGSSFYLPALQVESTNSNEIAAAVKALYEAIFNDPLTASLASLPGTTSLHAPAVRQGGFGSLALRATSVVQATDASLNLGVQGKLDISADAIDLNAGLSAPGGNFKLATVNASTVVGEETMGDIHLRANAVLDTAGLWTNDTRAAATGAVGPTQAGGGQISVTAARSLRAEPGARIDVSAGARLAGNGSITRGSAGSINLGIGRSELFDSDLAIAGVALRGFDFAGGGTLSLGVPALTVSAGNTAGFTLSPQFFSDGGFGTINVSAFGEVRIPSGTVLRPSLLNWELAAGYRSAASGRMSATVATPQTVSEELAERKPVNISIAAARPMTAGQGIGGANLVVERGAIVALEAGGKLTLTATGSLEVGASGGSAGARSELVAPGGAITLGIVGVRGAVSPGLADTDPAGFRNDQALWIGSDAHLSTAGTAKLRPDRGPVFFAITSNGSTATPARERMVGTVLGGGSITLAAQRGYVVADAGSVIALDGAEAMLSVAGLAGPVQVAKAAGLLKVSSPEGFVLDGTITAQPPRDAAGRALADGGTLDLSVGLGGVNTFTAGTLYPGSLFDNSQGQPIVGALPKPRQLMIGNFSSLVLARGASYGGNLAASFDNGIGYVPTALLQAAGFDSLRLGAGDRIEFDTSLSLAKPMQIALDAPALSGRPGVAVALKANTLSFGNTATARLGTAADDQAAPDTSPARATSLLLQATTIEVVGNSGLKGFSRVTLDAGSTADGEVRLTSPIGTNLTTPDISRWSLNFAGDLVLDAAKAYATTGTQFTLSGLAALNANDVGSRATFQTSAPGGTAATPLSAFGSLTVNATNIAQNGVLQQPFGAITLDAARQLSLGDHSVTSVSGNAAALVYGQTSNLSQWLAGNTFASQLPIDKGVNLKAQTLTTSATATVSAKGGGEIKAWEFFPGVGGTSDYYETSGLYAVLPDYAQTQASSFGGGRLDAAQQGKQIVITMDGAGLPKGAYSLLPARFALLGGSLPQGAFLVRRATDQGKTVLGKAIAQDDGSTVVTGYIRDTGSITVGLPGERFVVEPPATFAARSEVRLTSVSDLLASNAANLNTASPTLPRDGGRVQIAMAGTTRSTWQAAIELGGEGARAGLLDLSARRLALVDQLAKTPDGALGISVGVLTASGAGSVLLGGQRSRLADADDSGTARWAINVAGTDSLTVDLGTQALTVEELILAANGSVTLANRTKLIASPLASVGASSLAAVGDGVLAVVSANRVGITRTGPLLQSGNLVVGAASELTAAQVNLDATGALQIDSSAALSTQALELGARAIQVGGANTASPTTTRLADNLLAAVRQAPTLVLRSYSSIDFAGQQDWSQRPAAAPGAALLAPSVVKQQLVLDAPALRGINGGDGSLAFADLAARDVVLRNSSGLAAPVGPGTGTLLLQAVPALQFGTTGGLTLGPGNVALAFDQAGLRSGGDIVVQGSGNTSAQRDLTVASARLTAASGATQAINANAGTLLITKQADSQTLGERVGQGASLTLGARTLQQDGRVEVAGGNLTLLAAGAGSSSAAITFGAGSVSSVAGFSLPGPAGFEAFGHAGRISAVATQGTVKVLGTLDASAARRADGTAGNGDAGNITLQAAGAGGALVLQQSLPGGGMVSGQLRALAGASSSDLGGSLMVDVTSLTDTGNWAAQVSGGGFDRAVTLRARTGDLALGQDIKAQRINVSADSGKLTLGAKLDAASPSGGVVRLAASGDLELSANARIDARSQRIGANGGDVLLASSSGRVRLAPAAGVDTRGDDAQDGRIVLRALRGANNTSVNVDALNTAALQGAEVDIEAVRVYSTVTSVGVTRDITSIASGNNVGSTGTLGQTGVRTDSAAFMNAKAGILTALGVAPADTGRVNLRAGVEVRGNGNLTVSNDWQLTADRPGGDAGFLTLRAAGNLTMNGSISDGFDTVTSAGLPNDNRSSWSYRFSAGADLGAANALATQDFSAGATETGNLSISAGRLVRTGAGSIEMAAGRDIRFAAGSGATPAGVAYIAGRKMTGQTEVLASLFANQTAKPKFMEQGGRLELQAMRDVTAPEATQLINNWFWRSGISSSVAGEEDRFARASQPAWWTEFSRFQQSQGSLAGIGSFGGGDLRMSAGRDIVNLQAMAPSQGWADSVVRSAAVVQVRNGGDVTVDAGRNVVGGQLMVGRGEGRLTAGGGIGASNNNTRLQAPALALMDGHWSLAARLGIDTTGAFNPTAFSVSSSDNRSPVSGFFFTWGNGASLDLNANAGSINLVGMNSGQIQGLGLASSAGVTADVFARVMPATLKATAASSDINLYTAFANGAVLFPSGTGQLELWSGRDIRLGGVGQISLAMADSDPASWPQPLQPMTGAQANVQLAGDSGLIGNALRGQAAGTALHAGDQQPVLIHAKGSVDTPGLATLRLAKQSRISADENVLNLRLVGQNHDVADYTTITAGRNFLAGQQGLIELAGPGALEITAGRSIDLGSSAGVTTSGNLSNASLPLLGASIRMTAASAGTLNLPEFEARYLKPGRPEASARSSQYRDMLLASVRAALQQPSLSYEQALDYFKGFPAQAQADFGQQVLAAEFSAVYLNAPLPTAAQMTESLRGAFELRKAGILQAGADALATGESLVLPGREVLQGGAISTYLAELRRLPFDSLDIAAVVTARVDSLAEVQIGWREVVAQRLGSTVTALVALPPQAPQALAYQAALRDFSGRQLNGWRNTVAESLGSTVSALETLAAQRPQAPQVLAYQAALGNVSGRQFEAYRAQVLASQLADTGASASLFGRMSLPMRLALFDQGFQAAELAGVGSFVEQPMWQGNQTIFSFSGSMDMTQSSVITQRGGDIAMVNAGGGINVGLKDAGGSGTSTPKGVITLGSGDVFGYAKSDFQVNTQRVFVVGAGDMNIWTSSGDIDSGRGANTAVAAPPLAARRSIDGVVFEVPATTTGSGLGILEDANGQRAGTIGLFPAFGEILALDAFIRAPSVIVGAAVRGADNLQAASVGGAAGPVSAPPAAAPPPPASSESRAAETQVNTPAQEARQRNSLLTVDLLGLGPATAEEICSVEDAAAGKCCSEQDAAAGKCVKTEKQ